MGKLKMEHPTNIEEEEIQKFQALWERIDRRFWRKWAELMIALTIGAAVGIAAIILMIWFYLFIRTLF
jgi:hypothetical protein